MSFRPITLYIYIYIMRLCCPKNTFSIKLVLFVQVQGMPHVRYLNGLLVKLGMTDILNLDLLFYLQIVKTKHTWMNHWYKWNRVWESSSLTTTPLNSNIYIDGLMTKVGLMLGGMSCGVAANMLNCNIDVNEFELQSCYYVHFWTNTLGEKYEPPYLPGIDNQYHYYSSTRMALALITHESWYAIKQRNPIKQTYCTYIFILAFYIYHHHHVAPSAQISLTPSCHPSLSSIAPASLQGYILHLHRAAVCRF